MKIPDDHPFAKWALWQFGESWQDKILPRDIEEWDAAVGACAEWMRAEIGAIIQARYPEEMIREVGLTSPEDGETTASPDAK